MTKKSDVYVDSKTGEVIEGRTFGHLKVFTERTRRRPVVPRGREKVKSEFKDQCDINRIVARMKKTGDMSPLNADRPWQAFDTTQMPTNYTDALLLTIQVRDKFMQLSAEERQKYNNNPQDWVDALEKAQKAAREAQIAAQNAAVKEAKEEAEYRKKRRETSPSPSDAGKINK